MAKSSTLLRKIVAQNPDVIVTCWGLEGAE
jgi:hypothetical protein